MKEVLQEFTLENGLKVMLKEIHTAPLVSHWVWYGVGSRNELPGKTGLSHWVEHMQFKGSAHFSARRMEQSIAKTGGYWNAFTAEDWTTYFETLPASALDLAMQIEAERMQHSLFLAKEVETERTVILSEREGNENDPRFRLSEAVQFNAYRRHPYRNEVLGSKEDLLGTSREDLYKHYRNYYCPGNARLCIAGDFETGKLIPKIERLFGSVPACKVQKQIPPPEPEPPDYRLIELHGPGETSFIQAAYRCPEGKGEDFFALTLLDSLLAGPSSLNMFGSGGISNRTSRLYLALVDKGLAASVSGGINATIDPGTYTLNLTCNPAVSPQKLLKSLDREIEKLLNRPATQKELQQAQKQSEALFAYGSDNITNQAFWMGYASAFADYNWFLNYVERLKAVSAEELMQTARKYLNPKHRVTGIYQPVI
ncbi:MAG: pitrilysin family protein [Anaerolineaceae bacterium]|nr:pitrilysin family protein [Anaerolineaceae bacterium]